MALAIERYYECKILSTKKFERPVLDVGCGDGIFAKVLFSEQVDVGIDPNGIELARAKSEGAYKELIQCYGNLVPKPTAHFNTIFSNSVMEHIEDISPVLKECYRLLSSQGRMYLTLPTDKFEENAFVSQMLNVFGLTDLAKRFQKFYNGFWVHHHAYSVEGWTKLFSENGFRVTEHRVYASKKACLVNDILAYLALPSFLARKFFKRWFIFPRLRYLISGFLTPFWKPFLKSEAKLPIEKGGLIFFELQKI